MDIEVKCADCGLWALARAVAPDSQIDGSAVYGRLTKCPECKGETRCAAGNTRVAPRHVTRASSINRHRSELTE